MSAIIKSSSTINTLGIGASPVAVNRKQQWIVVADFGK
jgi:hypothetical protein